MAEPAALKVVVTGKVQGVMFRNFTLHHAENLGLAGYVRNLPGGKAVEIEAEGDRSRLEKLLKLVEPGPPHAIVESLSPVWDEYSGKYKKFKIEY
jgi:acylphosphatase